MLVLRIRCCQSFNKLEMALDPSEIYRYVNPSDEANLSELDEPSDERGYSDESEGEAQETDQYQVPDSQESNDHVPRWCREEQLKARVSGAQTRKRKQVASSQSHLHLQNIVANLSVTKAIFTK